MSQGRCAWGDSYFGGIGGAMSENPTVFLNVREVARRLSTCERYAWELVRRGDLQAIRVGRLVRIAEDDLEHFILKRQQSKPVQ